MNVSMSVDSVHQDDQGTTYAVQPGDGQTPGAIKVTITGRKSFGDLYGDAARMNEGKFQINLPSSPIWMQCQWAPMKFKYFTE